MKADYLNVFLTIINNMLVIYLTLNDIIGQTTTLIFYTIFIYTTYMSIRILVEDGIQLED